MDILSHYLTDNEPDYYDLSFTQHVKHREQNMVELCHDAIEPSVFYYKSIDVLS